MTAPDADSVPAESALSVVVLSFAVFGAMFGTWQVVLADLQAALGLSAGALGLALTAGTAASLPTMVLGGRAADRFGPRGLIVVAAVGLAAGLVATAAAGGFSGLVLALLLLYASSGAYDVGINAVAIEAERDADGDLMPYLHAAYSGSAAAGAVGAGAALAVGVCFHLLYLVAAAGLVAFAASVVAVRAFPHGDGDGGNGGGIGNGNRNENESGDAGGGGDGGDGDGDDTGPRSLFRHPMVLLVAVIALFAMFSEGTLENWSAIYLRRSLSLPADLGAVGVAAFHGAMLAGRLAAGRTVGVVGRRRLLQGAGVLGAAGMTAALLTTRPALVVVGFAVVGLAMSAVVPLAFSLAGELAPGRSGEASSVVTFVGYTAFLLGPALVGGLADATSLGAALATVVAAGVGIAFLSSRLPARGSGSRSEPGR